MAIIQLPLTHGLTVEAAFQIAKAAGLNRQSRTEVVQCWDMIQIWRDWVREKFGTLTSVRHRSGTDDPPDLDLIFENRTLAMEHTRLQPAHVGQAEALLRKSGQGGGLPSISRPPANFAEMRDIIAGVKDDWSSVIDDWNTIFDLLAVTLREKMRGMPNGGIIGIVHDLFLSDRDQSQLAKIAENIVNRTEFADFESYTLILLDRSTPSKFHSSLIRRGEGVLEKVGTPPPLQPADKKLLAEMIKATSGQPRNTPPSNRKRRRDKAT